MGPVAERKSWAELNKQRKEQRKKWKQKNLEKKVSKQPQQNKKTETTPTENAQTAPVKELATVSVAVPGSILENAQSAELRTYLAGQIARTVCIFKVDEVVVFDDYADAANAKKATLQDADGTKTLRQCCVQLGRILQYLECPQYLRKFFFPLHSDLKYAGLLNPLDAPHHLRQDDHFDYREGIVTEKPVKPGKGSVVNVGLLQDVHVDKLLTAGLRCTVKLLPQEEGKKKLKGVIVSPSAPLRESGVYWGYSVRLAKSLSQVFCQSPYKDGYDLTIGTSDKGTSIDNVAAGSLQYKHLLIVFGGLQGIEAAVESDEALDVTDASLLFDHYLNALPDQGSRTIRTEEAVLISLAALRLKLSPSI